jgi:hypothetical protein
MTRDCRLQDDVSDLSENGNSQCGSFQYRTKSSQVVKAGIRRWSLGNWFNLGEIQNEKVCGRMWLKSKLEWINCPEEVEKIGKITLLSTIRSEGEIQSCWEIEWSQDTSFDATHCRFCASERKIPSSAGSRQSELEWAQPVIDSPMQHRSLTPS